MSELLLIKNNQQFRDRVFPVHLAELAIDDPKVCCDYVNYWQTELTALKTRTCQCDLTQTKNDLKILDHHEQIARHVGDLIDMLSGMYTLPQGIDLETDFDALLNAVLQRLLHVPTSEHRFSAERDSEPDVSWADNSGHDEYGLYAELICQEASQIFRWICPGRFWMGSPEAEVDRRDDETLHEVILTKGFWLADTACIQHLWRPLMGDNPSGFMGKLRPVEKVSWSNIQDFINKLNHAKPGLQLRLPTESEWEYACRAGTTTPFNFGENITPEQVNYDGDNPYADGKKGLRWGETVEVKSLPANDWGLYEMHGNVWEWCADWYGAYAAGPLIDPQGPATGSARVLRGGSCFDGASNVRSALREGYDPDDHYYNGSGFRLARG